MMYVAGGRFHLESAMITNPLVQPSVKTSFWNIFVRETNGHETMLAQGRRAAAEVSDAMWFDIILGTLVRQGSTVLIERVYEAVRGAGKCYDATFLSEWTSAKINRMEGVLW